MASVECVHGLPSLRTVPLVSVVVPDSEEARDPAYWAGRFPDVVFEIWLHIGHSGGPLPADAWRSRRMLGRFSFHSPLAEPIPAVGYTVPQTVAIRMPDGSLRRATVSGRTHRSGLTEYGLVLRSTDTQAPGVWRELMRRRDVA
ncbi:MAG: hypothetical protein ACPGVG_17190 [Mycobacterium sp.]